MKCLVIFLNLEKNDIVMSQKFLFHFCLHFLPVYYFLILHLFYIVSKDSSVLHIKNAVKVFSVGGSTLI